MSVHRTNLNFRDGSIIFNCSSMVQGERIRNRIREAWIAIPDYCLVNLAELLVVNFPRTNNNDLRGHLANQIFRAASGRGQRLHFERATFYYSTEFSSVLLFDIDISYI